MKFFLNSFAESQPIYDFGLQPVTNRFLESPRADSPKYPLALAIEKNSGILHISEPFPISELKPRFSWLTCFEPEDHVSDLALYLQNLSGINTKSTIGGFSFKDDSILTCLQNAGFQNCWRLDPKIDLGVEEEIFSIETLQAHFNGGVTDRIKKRSGVSDIFIIRHSLEHFYNIAGFFEVLQGILKPGGYLVLEVPDCERAMRLGDCSMIWEEHTIYFTEKTLKRLLEIFGYDVLELVRYSYPLEDSLLVVARAPAARDLTNLGDFSHLNESYENARNYIDLLLKRRSNLAKIFANLNSTGKRISLLGVGHLSVMFMSIMALEGAIAYVMDDDSNKHGLFLPNSGESILGSEALYSEHSMVCLVGMNPLSHERVIEKNRSYVDNGGSFLSIFPGTSHYIEDAPFEAFSR